MLDGFFLLGRKHLHGDRRRANLWPPPQAGRGKGGLGAVKCRDGGAATADENANVSDSGRSKAVAYDALGPRLEKRSHLVLQRFPIAPSATPTRPVASGRTGRASIGGLAGEGGGKAIGPRSRSRPLEQAPAGSAKREATARGRIDQREHALAGNTRPARASRIREQSTRSTIAARMQRHDDAVSGRKIRGRNQPSIMPAKLSGRGKGADSLDQIPICFGMPVSQRTSAGMTLKNRGRRARRTQARRTAENSSTEKAPDGKPRASSIRADR